MTWKASNGVRETRRPRHIVEGDAGVEITTESVPLNELRYLPLTYKPNHRVSFVQFIHKHTWGTWSLFALLPFRLDFFTFNLKCLCGTTNSPLHFTVYTWRSVAQMLATLCNIDANIYVDTCEWMKLTDNKVEHRWNNLKHVFIGEVGIVDRFCSLRDWKAYSHISVCSVIYAQNSSTVQIHVILMLKRNFLFPFQVFDRQSHRAAATHCVSSTSFSLKTRFVTRRKRFLEI